MAKRLVRAKRKIRSAGIPMRVPGLDELEGRLAAVLRVVYLVFTEGHMASGGERLIREELCDTAVRLARALAGLLPDEPEVAGLALLLLTDARRPGRTDASGDLVVLEEQDRRRWDPALTAEGRRAPDRGTAPGSPRAVPALRRHRRVPLDGTVPHRHRLARSPPCTASCCVTSRPR
jgi:RNA polymerase sigma-70 factor, ECF subfamily